MIDSSALQGVLSDSASETHVLLALLLERGVPRIIKFSFFQIEFFHLRVVSPVNFSCLCSASVCVSVTQLVFQCMSVVSVTQSFLRQSVQNYCRDRTRISLLHVHK